MSNILKTFRMPIALFALASMVLVPSASAFAHENEVLHSTDRPPAIAFEIVSILDNGDGTGTIGGTIERVSKVRTENTGVTEGASIQIQYSTDTKFVEESEEVTIDSFEVGEIAFAVGKIDFDAMTLEARVIIDHSMHKPFFHLGEVVKIDADANTILVKSLRPLEEGEDVQYILVSYDEETIINEDGVETDESVISVGDKIHTKGEVNLDSEDYFAEIDADHVILWDELEPRMPKMLKHGSRTSHQS
ncbi:hypothetical protein HQ487_05075 [Candidatus Uhrbacteria bacterium]|nr:hypothetical protein [Candidatus Uhrbacteria bacterium]